MDIVVSRFDWFKAEQIQPENVAYHCECHSSFRLSNQINDIPMVNYGMCCFLHSHVSQCRKPSDDVINSTRIMIKYNGKRYPSHFVSEMVDSLQ